MRRSRTLVVLSAHFASHLSPKGSSARVALRPEPPEKTAADHAVEIAAVVLVLISGAVLGWTGAGLALVVLGLCAYLLGTSRRRRA